MALFGKKSKDAVPASPPLSSGDSSGDAAQSDGAMAAPVAPAKKGRAARDPKATKNKTVKNGVAVGLNIGNQYIKAVEVTSKGGELSVTAMGAVLTPPECYINGNVLSISALSNAIKDLWRSAGIKSKVTVISIAGTGALIVRVIEVPKMSDGELRDNMKTDADRYIPFPPSEVVMDFKALRDLPSDPDAPNMEVLLAAAQREVIDLHVDVVQKARLLPRAIDVEPIAATRALQLEWRNDGFIDYSEVSAVINIGATGAEISILRGDTLVFTRSIPTGGNSITQAIAEGLGLPFSDAEQIKIVSADALAPAGYGAATEDFNFMGGEENFDFGAEEFSGDFGQEASTGSASADPFDLDFFNQGPQQNEPGAGHAQKEDDFDSEENLPSFSFDSQEFAPAASFTPAVPPVTPQAPPKPTAPISFDFGDADDLSDEFLPAVAGSTVAGSTVADELLPTNSKATVQLSGSSINESPLSSPKPIEEEPEAVSSQPSVPTSEPKAVSNESNSLFSPGIPAPRSEERVISSAFDFDNFDLPATQATFPVSQSGVESNTTPLLEESKTPDATPFAFDVPGAFPSAASSEPLGSAAKISFDKPAESSFEAPETSVSPQPTPLDSEFDLDSIFGPGPANQSVPDPTGTDGSGIDDFGMDTSFLPDASGGTSAVNTGDFDLRAIDESLGNDFAGGFGVSADDFNSFGAGLDPSAATDAATLYGLIQPSLEELSNEVRRSLEFYMGRYPDITISRLILVGGGAKLRNLDVFFTQMMGVPAAVGNPFSHIKVQAPNLPPNYASDNGPLCVVALGLALRDFVD